MINSTVLSEIENKLNNQQLLSFQAAKTEIKNNKITTGFYWIYTNFPITKFLSIPTPRNNTAHIDLGYLSSIHQNLRCVIKQGSNSEWWCIYNGKDKNLNNRIQNHFSGTYSATSSNGNLALIEFFTKQELLMNFRVKYIACNAPNNAKGIVTAYGCLEKDLERVWRLNNGWSIFCCL